MKCSVFIAPSVDGYIATEDGDVQWLESLGSKVSKEDENSDLMSYFNNSFPRFIQSVDCMIMGRKLMEVLSSYDLTDEEWPYKSTKVIVLSHNMKEAPENLKERVEMYSGTIPALMTKLESEGYKHAYIDGGQTITNFLELKLINEMTLTLAPILLGSGVPLFNKMSHKIYLKDAQAIVFPNNFVEVKYQVDYK